MFINSYDPDVGPILLCSDPFPNLAYNFYIVKLPIGNNFYNNSLFYHGVFPYSLNFTAFNSWG